MPDGAPSAVGIGYSVMEIAAEPLGGSGNPNGAGQRDEREGGGEPADLHPVPPIKRPRGSPTMSQEQ